MSPATTLLSQQEIDRSESSLVQSRFPSLLNPIGSSLTTDPGRDASQIDSISNAVPSIEKSDELRRNEAIFSGTGITLTGEYQLFQAHVPSIRFSTEPASNIKEAWQLQIENQLDQLLSLPSEGGDEGASRVAEEAVNVAKQLIDRLHRSRQIACSEVFPMSGGGVEIEISAPFWEGAIWIEGLRAARYIVKIGGKTRSGTAAPEDIPDRIWESLG